MRAIKICQFDSGFSSFTIGGAALLATTLPAFGQEVDTFGASVTSREANRLRQGGVRTGSFLVLPTVQFDLAYNDNIRATQNNPVSDGIATIRGAQAQFVKILNEQIGPFGPQNLEPCFALANIRVQVADVLKDKHIRVQVSDWEGGSRMKGMFFYNSNMVAGYSNPAYLQECLANLELSVCIDVQMTETCHACDYVLPDTSYLERLELPEFYGGKIPAVAIRDQVIEKELALIKVKCPPENRTQVLEIVEHFKGVTVDFGAESLVLQISGGSDKIDHVLGLLGSYGVVEMVRSGKILMTRGASTT